ncbi:MAG: DNA repair protein RecO [Planctomycetota bacterium]
MLIKDSAICIRTLDYSETSQIVTLFTRSHGKIDAIAKGSKRPKSPFDGPIESISCGHVVFTETRSRLATLTEFDRQPLFTEVRKNLFILNCALFAAELLNGLTHENDPNPPLFDDITTFICTLQRAEDHTEATALLIVFQLTLLERIGSAPVLNACVNCRNTAVEKWSRTFFSSSVNGLLCGDCEPHFTDKIRLSQKAAKCLKNLRSIPDATADTVGEIEKLLIRHFTEFLQYPPRMAKHVIPQ